MDTTELFETGVELLEKARLLYLTAQQFGPGQNLRLAMAQLDTAAQAFSAALTAAGATVPEPPPVVEPQPE